jgi:hypothetical protein
MMIDEVEEEAEVKKEIFNIQRSILNTQIGCSHSLRLLRSSLRSLRSATPR